MCAATGYTVTICRKSGHYSYFFSCPTGRVIDIKSATVWYRRWQDFILILTENRLICKVKNNRRVQCLTGTSSEEITQCNGRQNCSLSLDAFNYPGSCDRRQRGNFVKITYNCIAGKRTCSVIRLFSNCSLYVKCNIVNICDWCFAVR